MLAAKAVTRPLFGQQTASSGPNVKTSLTHLAKFPSAGYWRLEASGPDGSRGWVIMAVGTAPTHLNADTP